jgi:hypothetical protein
MREPSAGPRSRGELLVRGHIRSRAELAEMQFLRLVAEGGLRHLRAERISLARDRSAEADDLGELLFSRRTDHGVSSVRRIAADAVALIDEWRGSASLEVAGADPATVERVVAEIGARMGALAAADDEVPMTFWALAAHGPRSARRRVQAPSWAETKHGYASSTSADVGRLMIAGAPDAGRLVLWHGEPGTGKTTALRALARAWQPWCSTHFVTDPEAFLGSGTSYLLDVLTSESSALDRRAPFWKLVVLEDAGELLSADAHARTGQALSRLLNVTDGLLGQGMHAILLVTTNEPLTRLHPAVQRAGRCWSQTEFLALEAPQANAWLERHGSAVRVARRTSLADLYAALRGEEPAERPAFGFGRAR